ncbi:MAG: hypothetical protein ACK559_31190, partial [bacterium]
MHRQHAGQGARRGLADRDAAAVETERKAAARARGVGQHRRDVGEHALGHARLESRVGQQLR